MTTTTNHPKPPLGQAADLHQEAKRLANAAVPDGATGRWIRRNYHQLLPLIQDQVSPLLTIAALHGATKNAKHEYFGNDAAGWLSSVTKLSLREANHLRCAANVLYEPRTLQLGPEYADLSAQKQSVVKRQRQTQLRQRVIELDLKALPFAALCRASDYLPTSCKHRRLEVINNALDQATEFTPEELRSLAAKEVRRIRRAEQAEAESLREAELSYQKPDEFGFVTAYSYAPQADQAVQQALLTDCQKEIRALFRRAGLPDPYTQLPEKTRRWKTHDWTLKLGHAVLRQGLAIATRRGQILLNSQKISRGSVATRSSGASGATSVAGAALSASTPNVASGICADGATSQTDSANQTGSAARAGDVGTISENPTVSQASLVIYAHIDDLLTSGWRHRIARTNAGATMSLGKATELTGPGIDQLAIVDKRNRGIIHTITSDSAKELHVTESLRSDTAIPDRFANRLQRLLLGLVQPYCAHPGCRIPAINCQAHHLIAHQQGGITAVENLALLCTYHHPKNDDSRSKPHQGHYDKDADGVVYWQPHGDPLPPPQYNPLNLKQDHHAPDKDPPTRCQTKRPPPSTAPGDPPTDDLSDPPS